MSKQTKIIAGGMGALLLVSAFVLYGAMQRNTSINYVINTSISQQSAVPVEQGGEETATDQPVLEVPTEATHARGDMTTPSTSIATSNEVAGAAQALREHENVEQSKEIRTHAGEVDTVSVPIYTEGTVLSGMEALRAAADFTFSGTQYPGLGFFVDTIQGHAARDGYYWILYVNGKSASLGASSMRVVPGDTVEWRYEQGRTYGY